MMNNSENPQLTIPRVMPRFFDSNGVEITDACKVFNRHNDPQILNVEERSGELWFGSEKNGWCKLTEKYNTKEFWTIKKQEYAQNWRNRIKTRFTY